LHVLLVESLIISFFGLVWLGHMPLEQRGNCKSNCLLDMHNNNGKRSNNNA